MKNRKKVIYIGILVLITVIVSITYFSYAFLTQTDVHNGKINIVAGTLTYRLKMDNVETNTVIVPANDTKEIEVKVKSLNSINSKFELYYLTINGVDVNYSSAGDLPSGTLGSDEEDTIYIILTNYTSSNKEVTFGIKESLVSNNVELSTNMNSITVMSECNVPIGTVYNFDYTGSAQTFTPTCKGKYKVELWGASGGGNGAGLGGYTSGYTAMSSETEYYIYVGQGGSVSDHDTSQAISYNGGGTSSSDGNDRYWGSGGGATDIRLSDGNWNSFDSLKSRIMVAAGGGGSYYAPSDGTSYGGSGGGLNGYNANNISYYGSGYGNALGATQSAGGVCGNGTYMTYCVSGSFGSGGTNGGPAHAGGGGGYYGGSRSGHVDAAAGGSSFISGYSGCNAISESSTSSSIVHTNQPNHYSDKVFSNGVMIDGKGCNWSTGSAASCGANQPQPNGTNAAGHTGNGYARITYLGNGDTTTGTSWIYDYTGNIQEFNVPKDGIYKLETWGAQGGTYNATYYGGYGGYSVGNVELESRDILAIGVGGQPVSNTVIGTNSGTACTGARYGCGIINGGYNGGGDGYHRGDCVNESGGGATHIAINNNLGELKNYSSATSDVLIVSGGGGGAAYLNTSRYGIGGSAGGNVGVNGRFGTNSNCESYGYGGTQTTAGGTYILSGHAYAAAANASLGGFGYGGTGDREVGGVGGGAGWYGGGATSCLGGGGGGSGYIGNSLLTDKKMVCYNCTTSTAVNTYTESNTCVNATPTSDCSKMGNGYAKITYMGTRKVIFNANGGSVNEQSREVNYGSSIGTLPIPTKSGKVFLGWFTENTYVNKVSTSYSVKDNITLYALWGTEVNLNLGGRTRGYPSDTSNPDTTRRSYTPNTYVVGLAFNNYYSPSAVSSFSLTSNGISLKTSSGYGIAIPVYLENGNYRLSALFTVDQTGVTPYVSAIKYASDGTFTRSTVTGSNGSILLSFNIDSSNAYEALVFTSNGTGVNISYTNIHLYKLD